MFALEVQTNSAAFVIPFVKKPKKPNDCCKVKA